MHINDATTGAAFSYLHHTTLHRMASHRITSHHITSHRHMLTTASTNCKLGALPFGTVSTGGVSSGQWVVVLRTLELSFGAVSI